MDVTATINGLRWIADLLARVQPFLEEHPYERDYDSEPSVASGITLNASPYGVEFNVYGENQRELMAELRRLLRLRDQWNKGGYGDTFNIRTAYTSDHPTVTISGAREAICTKRVVGTETVTHPAVEAQPERTEEREIVEWDCGTLLDDDEREAKDEAVDASTV